MGTHCKTVDWSPPSAPETRLRLMPILLLGLFCAVYVVSPVAAQAQRREMLLSLREATAFALQENLDIQIAGLNPRIREAQVTEEKGIFDVNAQAALRASSSQLLTESSSFRDIKVGKRTETTPLGDITVAGTAAQEDEQIQEASLGVSQLTPYGGTYEIEISERHQNSNRRVLGNFDDPTFDINKFDVYTTELGLKFSQPLLKNFGSTVTRNQILIAQNNLSISQEDFRQRIIEVAASVQQIYWDLIFRRQDLKVRHQQLELNQKLLEQIRKQVAVGTLAPIEVLQAETNIARTKQFIIVAENAVQNAEDRLKRVMNFSLTSELADVELVPTDMPTYTVQTIDQTEQNHQALQFRPDLIQAKISLENQNIRLVFNKNQVLPTLNMEASFIANGLDKGFGSSIGEMDVTDRYRWEVGLIFRYPLSNRQARGRLQQAGLELRQQMLRIKNLEENIIAEVRAAVRDVRTNSQRVQATRAASRLAQRQLEAEEKKLRVGLATVFTVLVFQDELAQERSNEINALTEYMQALVRLEAVKGTLLDSYHIVIQSDGPRLQ
jgi:outer membrane protein